MLRSVTIDVKQPNVAAQCVVVPALPCHGRASEHASEGWPGHPRLAVLVSAKWRRWSCRVSHDPFNLVPYGVTLALPISSRNASNVMQTGFSPR